MKFLISVIDELKNPGTAAEMIEIDNFNDSLRSNGQLIFAWGLQPPETATVIDNRNDANISTGKPLFEAQENFSGLWLVEAESAAEAERLAHSASKACNRRVELRPMHQEQPQISKRTWQHYRFSHFRLIGRLFF